MREVRLNATLEEIEVPGVGLATLDVEMTFHCYPGEAEVRYYPDGSGYPGSPAQAEFIDCYVTKLYLAKREVVRSQYGRFTPLFLKLDKLAESAICEGIDRWEQEALEVEDAGDY